MLLLVLMGFIIPEKLDRMQAEHGDFITATTALVTLFWIFVAVCGYCEPTKGTLWFWLREISR